MPQLSELVAMFKKQGAPPTPNGPRDSARQRVNRGFTRGMQGSMGSKPLQRRNSQAGLDKEPDTMNSPIFQAFVGGFKPRTPIRDYLNSRGA